MKKLVPVIAIVLGGFLFTVNAANAVPVSLVIHDTTDLMSFTLSGSVTSGGCTLTQENIGVLGGVDCHLGYISDDPLHPSPGTSFIQNFNMFGFGDESPSIISDTLSVTATGVTPSSGTDANVNIDLHFRSGDLSEIFDPPALSNAIPAPENGSVFPFFPATQPFIFSLNDFYVEWHSVPEPSSLALFGTAMAVLCLAAVCRRSKVG